MGVIDTDPRLKKLSRNRGGREEKLGRHSLLVYLSDPLWRSRDIDMGR